MLRHKNHSLSRVWIINLMYIVLYLMDYINDYFFESLISHALLSENKKEMTSSNRSFVQLHEKRCYLEHIVLSVAYYECEFGKPIS